MDDFLNTLTMATNLALFLLGFGFIVFVHELGHFVAARWAGIRVLAFAIGFGPALCSYRKGLGFRWGSSEKEYHDRLRAASGDGPDAARAAFAALSPTEYRFNYLPLGGYVKMLGQDDLNPTAVSDAPDSYQSTPPWKRMVVISAGVVMNLIFAASVFVLVFMLGLKTEPAWIGGVDPGSPASQAVALNASDLGVTQAGLLPGDKVMTVNDKVARKFMDVVLATAMSKKGEPVRLLVEREGVSKPLEFGVVPVKDRVSGMLAIGVEPAKSATLLNAATKRDREAFDKVMTKLGLAGVEPGMTLVRAGDRPVRNAHDLAGAMATSDGKAVELEFSGSGGRRAITSVKPTPAFQHALVQVAKDRVAPIEHVLGLMPVMKIAPANGNSNARAHEQGLADGDVFAQIGTVEYPSVTQGMGEIQANKGKKIPVVVLRRDSDGTWREVALEVEVTSKGTIGFGVTDTADESALVARPHAALTPVRAGEAARPPAAHGVFTVPGSRILSVDGRTVGTFAQVREALREAARGVGTEGVTIPVVIELPRAGVERSGETATIAWSVSREAVRELQALSWESPIPTLYFQPVESVIKGGGPIEAIALGLHETHDVMMNTYLTFARLFQGTVQVQHLKGPVGIAHMGTLIAERGPIWLCFFLALISVNLAVINFLPLPIVDGGQFLLLVWEAVRGRPAPIAVQNGLTLAGLVLIGCVFLVVTFNDIRNLIGV